NYERIYSSQRMHTPHWSTCSENLLAMVAALSSLQIMARDDLAARAEALGLRFRRRLQASHERFNLVTDLRGKGLMIGVGLTPQPGPLRLLMSLLLKHRINVSTSAPRWDALKLLPPLTIDDAVVDEFCDALDSVLENEDI
ncbi:MAG: aminotransferase class III-fold pyridoxal phosphate-dependent enzyme, partial [Myxococcales bacterium]|nr:aminotransferase class III-fold pyridoxal phosphate-dependent enzyme [Myxococcales bacterium]